MIETWAPGKLFIAGEYAVVEPAQPAVLVAVNRGIRVRLTERAHATAASASSHVLAALDVIEELRGERGLARRYGDLSITSELEDEHGVKYGLGSSAAVTTAVIDAFGQLYELGLSDLERFKLSLLATITVTPQASGGDLAASTFGGWLRYSAPNRTLLATHRAQHGVSAALDDQVVWQGLEIRTLTAPQQLCLAVGWTGSPASTEALVGQSGIAGHEQTPASPLSPHDFLAASRACVDSITRALEGQNDDLAGAVSQARRVLQQFSAVTGTCIETDTLRDLCDIAESHGYAAKPSGAGGGDCGIVLVTPGANLTSLHESWREHSIQPLDIAVYETDVVSRGGTHER